MRLRSCLYPKNGIKPNDADANLEAPAIYGFKPIVFEGNSREVLAAFTQSVRQDIGRQLFRLQEGKDPDDWKPFKAAGSGCREIRIRDATGIYRVIYVVLTAEAVHVLHCFQKKSEKTPLRDVSIAMRRFKALKRRIEDG